MQDLTRLFGEIGTVESTHILEDRETGRSRVFAFVEMSTQAEGETAIAQLNGKEVDGRELKVNEAKPQEKRGGFGGGGGGGGRGGRGSVSMKMPVPAFHRCAASCVDSAGMPFSVLGVGAR